LRKNHDCFKDGKYELSEARAGVFAFTRGTGDDRVLAAVNTSDTDRRLAARGFNFDLLKNEHTEILTVKAGEAGIFSIR